MPGYFELLQHGELARLPELSTARSTYGHMLAVALLLEGVALVLVTVGVFRYDRAILLLSSVAALLGVCVAVCSTVIGVRSLEYWVKTTPAPEELELWGSQLLFSLVVPGGAFGCVFGMTGVALLQESLQRRRPTLQ